MAKTEFVLWGTPKGAKSWEEEIITVTTDTEHLEKAKAWATEQGFYNIRVMNYVEGTKPNFINTINIK